MREKVGKSRFTVFFQWFVAPEGRKVGSLKRRVRRHLVRWEMKNCTPLWREAHFEVKRITKNTTGFGPLLDVEMSKKRTLSWHEAYFEVKFQDTPCLEHVWKHRRRKIVRRCGAKHVEKCWRSRTTFGIVISSCNFSCSFGDFFVQFFVLSLWFPRATCHVFFVILCTVYLFSDFSTWQP